MTQEADIATANQGDTVDLICQRHYGYTAGVTERVIEANPGLAQLGAQLPMGTRVTLPAIQQSITRKTINLWD